MTGGKKGKGKKRQRKTTKNLQQSPQPTGETNWDSLQNDDVMNILSRLPVETLLRFRCVCKSWKSLIHSPKFISLHFTRHHLLLSPLSRATTPSLLIRSDSKLTLDNKLSLFNLSPRPRPPFHAPPLPLPDAPSLPLRALSITSHAPPSPLSHATPSAYPSSHAHPAAHPCSHAPPLPVVHAPPPALLSSRRNLELSQYYPKTLLEMDVVGSWNGVVCVSQPPQAQFISLFNPATGKHRLLRRTIHVPADPEVSAWVSVGFGFDPIDVCFKVISVLNFSVELKRKTQLHVYNCNKDSWKILQGPPYMFVSSKCEVIVGGVPYWMALISTGNNFLREVLVWFDVHDEVFDYLYLPPTVSPTIMKDGVYAKLNDWKGELGWLMCQLNKCGDTFVEVWLLEMDVEYDFKVWTKKYIVGPIFRMSRMVGCSRNGQIVGLDWELKLMLIDPNSGRVARFDVDEDDIEKSFEVYNYRASFVSFKGESPVGQLPLQEEVEEASKRTGVGAKVRMEPNGDYEVALPSNLPPGYKYLLYKELLEEWEKDK